MFTARIFTTGEIVEARDVLEGKYSRNENFVDVEEDFRVVFVRKAKNDGKPYFRFYYSLEDYRRLFPDKADRYEILLKQRHFQETPWHREWESKFKDFAKTEKTIRNENTEKYKIADAYYEETKTCIEFQHSFIDFDFEERNKFYKELGINTIWLYDLTHLEAKPMPDGSYQILEDNNKGFFRIAENKENLSDNFVFIQTKDNMIYQVEELFRKQIDGDLKSTIRYFHPFSVNTETEFIERVKADDYRRAKNIKRWLETEEKKYTDLYSLWKPGNNFMLVKCRIYPNPLFIRENPKRKGEMETEGFTIPPDIVGRHFVIKNNVVFPQNHKYTIDDELAKKPIWKLYSV